MTDSERPGRLDELNVVQLNLIAALDQVTSSYWKVMMVRQGRRIQVECEALERYGVPHGLDNDVASALISEYAIAGMPEDGRLTLSATKLLRASGFSLGGLYYDSLHDSLRRLATTTYTVSEGGWRDADRRWTHASFHFLEDLEVSTKDGARLFDERTIIRLRLADKITASIRSGFTKPLDVDFMLSLSRPRARVLYRVLDAARYDLDTGEYLQSLTLGLEELVALCKLTSSRPDNVVRSLESVHAELKKEATCKR
ncbi:replication initiator protein A [Deinococcus malanensis]|uniref:replication initiator protein A n=1 Tax=Deinococcus malanensis TaxID=1706855 RepID=UPI0036371DF4